MGQGQFIVVQTCKLFSFQSYKCVLAQCVHSSLRDFEKYTVDLDQPLQKALQSVLWTQGNIRRAICIYYKSTEIALSYQYQY